MSQNASKRCSVRLIGLAEARTLNQDLGAAEELYRELIAPFEPAPAILRRHFQDQARNYLELEAWERIRDARLEHRWQQADIKRRQLFLEMDEDLTGGLAEVIENGLLSLQDSPAKFGKLTDYLIALKEKLENHDFDLEPLLHSLYGKDLQPNRSRAQLICIRCERLMKPQGQDPLTEGELNRLIYLVQLELMDAQRHYKIELDTRTMSRAACMASLGATREDLWMERQGAQLRAAIDRKQWVITGLLQALGLAHLARPNDPSQPAPDDPPGGVKNAKTNLRSPLKSTKVGKNKAKTKLNQAELAASRRSRSRSKPFRISRNSGTQRQS